MSSGVGDVLREALTTLKTREAQIDRLLTEQKRVKLAVVGLEKLLKQAGEPITPSATRSAPTPRPQPKDTEVSGKELLHKWLQEREPGTRFRVPQVADALGLPAATVASYCSRLFSDGAIRRVATGLYATLDAPPEDERLGEEREPTSTLGNAGEPILPQPPSLAGSLQQRISSDSVL